MIAFVCRTALLNKSPCAQIVFTGFKCKRYKGEELSVEFYAGVGKLSNQLFMAIKTSRGEEKKGEN